MATLEQVQELKEKMREERAELRDAERFRAAPADIDCLDFLRAICSISAASS